MSSASTVHNRGEQPRERDRVGRARAVDPDRAIRSHRETAPHRVLDVSIADGHDNDLVALGTQTLPRAKRFLRRVRIPLVEREVEVVRVDVERVVGELDLVAKNCDLLHANDDLHAAAMPPFTPL
jgi:hypothetical protein